MSDNPEKETEGEVVEKPKSKLDEVFTQNPKLKPALEKYISDLKDGKTDEPQVLDMSSSGGGIEKTSVHVVSGLDWKEAGVSPKKGSLRFYDDSSGMKAYRFMVGIGLSFDDEGNLYIPPDVWESLNNHE